MLVRCNKEKKGNDSRVMFPSHNPFLFLLSSDPLVLFLFLLFIEHERKDLMMEEK